jgi:hypothetical protein
MDRWRRCQSSLRNEATAPSSVCLYFDELATFHEIEIRCRFKAFFDSTSAISNDVSIRDLIPKRQEHPHNADCMAFIKDASRVISRMRLEHVVKSSRETKTKFNKLPFAAQLNTICDRMATRYLDFHRDGEWPHKASHFRPGTCQYKYSTGTRLSTSHYVSRLRTEISADIHRDFLQVRHH